MLTSCLKALASFRVALGLAYLMLKKNNTGVDIKRGSRWEMPAILAAI